MSVLSIVHTESSLGWGGQEIRILTEGAGLIARGHAVTLVCPPQARIAAEAARFGVPVRAAAIDRKSLRGVLGMRRELAALRADVINTHSSTDSWLAALACAASRGAPPIVRTRHISAAVPGDPFTRWLYTRAAARIVTTGEAISAQLVRDNGFAQSRIESIPTGIDHRRFVPGDRRLARVALGLDPGRRLVGIVATLRSWKGHRYLLDAFAGMGRADVDLAIVGDGPQRAALGDQVQKLGATARVHFAGNQQDVLPWLQALDVFCLSSYANEGVPQALLQAMFAGVPCVTTDAGAIPEIATANQTAIVVARQDAASLRAGIARLLDDPDLAARLAVAAREKVTTRHTLERMLDRMERVFRQTVDERRG